MIDENIYRYIPFETLVGMVQNQSLTFVLPELWDDPKEASALISLAKSFENPYDRIVMMSIYCKTFCQCWTSLQESDAMWRIYSYDNRSIRIRILKKDVDLLNNVWICPVEYGENFTFDIHKKHESYIQALSKKRLAFEHEKEIRLINPYQFSSGDDMLKHINAFMAYAKHPKALDIAEKMYPGKTIEEQVNNILSLLNIGDNKQQTKQVSFSHIPNFIKGVMVHPLAPDWYVEIVRKYCELNQIHFDGKSKLYAEDS